MGAYAQPSSSPLYFEAWKNNLPWFWLLNILPIVSARVWHNDNNQTSIFRFNHPRKKVVVVLCNNVDMGISGRRGIFETFCKEFCKLRSYSIPCFFSYYTSKQTVWRLDPANLFVQLWRWESLSFPLFIPHTAWSKSHDKAYAGCWWLWPWLTGHVWANSRRFLCIYR